jgi:hypothetical protein
MATSDTPAGPRAIPRGLEVLVKKAAVDPAFKQALLQQRAAAADAIGLKLEPAEAAMLTQVPPAQLEAVIARTTVAEQDRRVFMGAAAAAMLAALGGVALSGCGDKRQEMTRGNAPDRPPPVTGIAPDRPPAAPTRVEPTDGVRPDRPLPKTEEPKAETREFPAGGADGRARTLGHSPDRPV